MPPFRVVRFINDCYIYLYFAQRLTIPSFKIHNGIFFLHCSYISKFIWYRYIKYLVCCLYHWSSFVLLEKVVVKMVLVVLLENVNKRVYHFSVVVYVFEVYVGQIFLFLFVCYFFQRFCVTSFKKRGQFFLFSFSFCSKKKKKNRLPVIKLVDSIKNIYFHGTKITMAE